MRWKNHKKIHKLCWLSFICTFFVAIFLNTNNIYADTPSATGVKPLTDQQLIALISKADKSNTIATAPKINDKDIFLNASVNKLNPQSKQSTNPSSTSRCIYNGQNYVIGDLVNTELGWLRCTQSFFFSAANPTVAQYGEATWAKVQ